MTTAKRPYQGDGDPRGGRRRVRFMAVGAVALAAALTAAGCSSSGSGGSSGGSSSGGKTTITELDYFTTGGTNTAVNTVQQAVRGSPPRRHGQA